VKSFFSYFKNFQLSIKKLKPISINFVSLSKNHQTCVKIEAAFENNKFQKILG